MSSAVVSSDSDSALVMSGDLGEALAPFLPGILSLSCSFPGVFSVEPGDREPFALFFVPAKGGDLVPFGFFFFLDDDDVDDGGPSCFRLPSVFSGCLIHSRLLISVVVQCKIDVRVFAEVAD